MRIAGTQRLAPCERQAQRAAWWDARRTTPWRGLLHAPPALDGHVLRAQGTAELATLARRGGRVRGRDVRSGLQPHCTFAVMEAFPLRVNVQVFVLFPPLEQAPDQTTSRLFVALSVIVVPVVNDAEPLLPTATLMPAGLDVTRSPPRPVAVTVSVAVCG